MSRRVVGTVTLAFVLVAAALLATVHGQSGEYKIGVLEPLTGPLAGEGKRHLEGYEITREGVRIITGTFSSRLCGAASEAAARHNVIYWETSCVDPRFNKRGLKNV